MKVYAVFEYSDYSLEHWGNLQSLHLTKEGAEEEAAKLLRNNKYAESFKYIVNELEVK